MPSFIRKVDRDQDLYVEWSTVVDNLYRVGTRAEMLAHLESQEPRGYAPLPGSSPEDRLRRADEIGTTALFWSPPYQGSWEDEELMVEQRGMLARDKLGAYIDALFSEDRESAYALLRPFED